MRSFGSDNHSGVHPEIMNAIVNANTDHVCAYGDDEYTRKAAGIIENVFGSGASVFFVFNGTGANVVSLRACTNTFNSVICAETAHITVDECGAPAFMSGAAIKECKTTDGKLTVDLINQHLKEWDVEHHSQPKVVSISQCTELGTVYTVEELKKIADYVHKYDMYLHVDGARIYNAAVSLNKTLKEIITDTGVDIFSLGGTKNGMLLGEAVVSFRPELTRYLKFYRKQSTQLCSKMRFISCQYVPFFEKEIWKDNARHANEMAQLLRNELSKFDFITFTQKTQANIILLKTDRARIDTLLKQHFFYFWNEDIDEIRLVTSWNTTPEDIENFIKDVRLTAGLR